MMKNEVLNVENRYFYTNQILSYYLLLLSIISSIIRKNSNHDLVSGFHKILRRQEF